MRVAAVIGSPVRHSLSPALHNAAFRAAGLDWVYVAFEVAPGVAAEALAAMRTLGLGGLSVTTPHKEDVAAAVDSLAPAAAALRSVNTVVWSDGQLVGHSTDGDGFVASLEASGVAVGGRAVTVVGAGAAARSLVDALGRAGVGDLVDRQPHAVARGRGRGAVPGGARRFGRGHRRRRHRRQRHLHRARDRRSCRSTRPCSAPAQVVADLVYHPLQTALLRAAAARGCTTLDGLGMLVHQAALQQQLWTGIAPDPAAMRAAAEAELARRP